MEHHVKTWPRFFKPAWDGDKPFEVRRNDRDYKVGDGFVQHEYDSVTRSFSGRVRKGKITYILEDTLFVRPGYVVIGLELGTKHKVSPAVGYPNVTGIR